MPKDGPEDILVKISAVNRGPESADLHLLPTLWFRNDWSAWIAESNRASEKPMLYQAKSSKGISVANASHNIWVNLFLPVKVMCLCCLPKMKPIMKIFFPDKRMKAPYVKDGINNYVVNGNKDAVNPDNTGTKVAGHYQVKYWCGKNFSNKIKTYQSTIKKQSQSFSEKVLIKYLQTDLRKPMTSINR